MGEFNPEDFENIGRNDPCPCGSGKKFKKCHERELRLKKESEKKSRSVQQLVGPQTIPWTVYNLLVQIRESNLLPLFHEFTHSAGPFQERYPRVEDFVAAKDAGTDRLPCANGHDLRWIRHDGPDVHLLLATGLKDPKMTSVHYEVITLRPNEVDADRGQRTVAYGGWRVWDVQRFERAKSEMENYDLSLAELGFTWQPEWKKPTPAVAAVSPVLDTSISVGDVSAAAAVSVAATGPVAIEAPVYEPETTA